MGYVRLQAGVGATLHRGASPGVRVQPIVKSSLGYAGGPPVASLWDWRLCLTKAGTQPGVIGHPRVKI